MKVKLSVAGNPDFGEPSDLGVPACWAIVGSYAEASAACQAFLDSGGYGGGNWTGGDIEVDGAVVAAVSFNGKVWEGPVCAYNPY